MVDLMFSQKYLIKGIYVVAVALGLFACSTYFASASKIQKFFRNHCAQGQTIFQENKNDALRAYQTLLSFCGDQDKLDQVSDIKKLAGGFSGAIIFGFTLDQHSYVGRLFAADHDQQEMLQEVNAQSAVADVGYAPKIYLYDLQRRSVIMDCVQGKNLNDPALVYDEALLRECALALRAMHSVTESTNPNLQIHKYTKNRIGLDAQALIKTCTEMFPESLVIQELQRYAQQLCDVANSAQHTVALTHNDIHGGNILVDDAGSVKIIDWTDSGYDNPLNDCAIFLNELAHKHASILENREKFLKYYLGRDPSPEESAWLRILLNLYRIEVIGHIITNPSVIANPSSSFQELLKKSIEFYVRDGVYDEELVKNSGYIVHAIRAWIEEIKQYISQELSHDQMLILKES